MAQIRRELLLTVLFALVGCDRGGPAPTAEAAAASQPPAPEMAVVRVSGSSALHPLVNAAKERFESKQEAARVEAWATDSRSGLVAAASGAVQVGTSDVFAPPYLRGTLVDHRVAVVGYAAMANKGAYNAKVTGISMQDLARIFTGEVRSWKELGGDSQPIVVINRAPGSGTRMVFGTIVLGGDAFAASDVEESSGKLLARLRETKGAISYLALSYADYHLRTLPLKTDKGIVEPTAQNIVNGSYPIWSYEHMYTKGEAAGAAKQFLDYVVSADFQDAVVPTLKGFISIRQMTVSRDED
jgi:phosphate transport system substrate-binding protein